MMSTRPLSLPRSGSPVYNRVFWLVFSANTTLVLANALTFRFAEFVRFLGGTEQLTGVLVGSGALAAIAVRLKLGDDIDSCGVRRLWMTCTALFVTGCGLLVLTASLSWVLYAARIAFSVGMAGMFTCSMVCIQNAVPADRRTEAIGSLGTSGFIGMIAGVLLGDLVFSALPDGSTRYTILFGAALALGVVYLVIILFVTLDDSPRPTRTNPSVFYLVFRYWPGSVMLVALVMGTGLAVTTVFLTRMATARNINGIGTFFTGYALSALIIRVMTRNWSRTLGRRRMILLGLCGHTCGHLLLITVSSQWHFILPSVSCGMGHALLFPAVISLSSGAFPRRFRGTGTTFALGVTELGVVLFSPLLGWIIDNRGFNAMFATSSAITVTFGVVYLVTSRRLLDDERLVDTTSTSDNLKTTELPEIRAEALEESVEHSPAKTTTAS